MSTFIHLRAHSDYSIGISAVKIKELVKKCAEYKLPALCLAEHGNLFGSLEFSQACIKFGIQPIIGCIIKVDEAPKNAHTRELGELLLIAKNNVGWRNLLKLVSNSFLEGEHGHEPYIHVEELIQYIEGLIAIAGSKDTVVGKSIIGRNQSKALDFLALLNSAIPGDVYLEVQRNVDTYNEEFEAQVLELALRSGIPIVATNDVYFLTPEMREAQDALLCIHSGRKLDDPDRQKVSRDCYLRMADEMIELFRDLPEAIENSINIAKKCTVYAEKSNPLLPSFSGASASSGATEEQMLANAAATGLKHRLSQLAYDVDEVMYEERLQYELSVINKMRFPGYFLIVSDFIKWSKSSGIPVGPGRGSGAGSVVAWALEITDLDPIKFGLLFERFLNPDRVSMPDFDIDFCQERREEVIQYVQKKYGSDRVASIVTFGKLQPRAVLRDVGRVLGMDYISVDRICKMVPNNPANPITLAEAIALDKELQRQRDLNPIIAKLLAIGLQLEGMNRHVSTHAAGIVIADRPLVELVPMYRDENSSMPAIQYNMKAAEEAGLVKFDFLGLKTLTSISWTCDLINKRYGGNFDINSIPLDDEKTYKLLSRGETIGVFQFESVGMKETIKKLKPDQIGDLIALGSLYRPGPMDNIPSYINRKHGYEKPEYLHAKMEEILRETYGIIVYQEQVIMIAQALAGYTLGQADLLRRAMGKKIKAEMEANREMFIKGAINNGIDAKLAEEIFDLIDKFASYGFNKSHAAAYALISYQTAYLKANYPIEFFTASLNLEASDPDKINLFISDARSYGIKVLPPCINNSDAQFVIENDAIRYGLGAIKNVGRKAVESIVAKRAAGFASLEDFVKEAGTHNINKRMLESLSRAGAFDCFGHERSTMLTNVERIISWAHTTNDADTAGQGRFLFDDLEATRSQIQLIEGPQWSSRQLLGAEFEAFGFYLSTHPIEEYMVKLKKLGVTPAILLDNVVGAKSSKLKLAGVITSKKIKSSSKGKYAFLQLSDKSGIFDISIFDAAKLAKYNAEGLLAVGKVAFIIADARKDKSGMRIIVEEMLPIEEATCDVNTSFRITIKDANALDALKNCIVEEGAPVVLMARLPGGEEVKFKNSKPIFVDPERISMLRGLKTIEITEE